MKLRSKGGDDASVRLEIVRAGSSISGGQTHSFFEPHSEVGSETTPTQPRGGGGTAAVAAPEKKLTLFAFRVAMLEKSATGIGTLAFVWATVVILGGFAITLERKDFVFVTVIIVTESARVYSRSHELEWQHQSTWAMAAAVGERYSLRAVRSSSRFFLRTLKAALHPLSVLQIEHAEAGREHDRNSTTNDQGNAVRVADRSRSWQLPNVPLLPYAGWVFVAKNTSRLLLWLQIASSAACVALSITRLVQHDFGEGGSEHRNRKGALILFYSLALAEAMIFLMEKAYWWWQISYRYLFQVVSRECFPGSSGGVDVAVTRFFYDTYSKCVAGSVFDGLKMDLVSFATELLASNLRDEQLIGARVLRSFAGSDDFGFDTLRKIGTSTAVVERLVEMLSWKNAHPKEEEELRRCAAEILTKLAGKRQNVLRVGAVPSAMAAISSLLGKPADTAGDYGAYDFSAFNLLGLSLLKRLAADHDNCWKISNSRGLLPKIIDLTGASRTLLTNELAPESQIKTVKRALEVVKMLAGTTGNPGIMLRQQLSEIVFTVSNVREIIRYGERHRELQTLAVEILKSLAMDGDAKDQIGRTGQVTSLLLAIFLNPSVTNEEKPLRNQAGETLSILALENKNNCNRIADEPEVLSRLMEALDGGDEIQLNASRILRNLCAYGGARTGPRQHLQPITAALPTVLKAIMATEGKLLEASLGLTTQICKLTTTPGEFSDALSRAGVEEAELAEKLAAILRKYASPEITVPRMRRFVINQAIWMMKSNRSSIDQFKKVGMERLLESVAETTSELECFHIFSGSVGFSRQSKSLLSRVEKALKLMRSIGS
ncbi:uncharacterized protein LOC122002988 [Zingiber officinale]|uniref:ARM repeat superfamily protein n=1 Tax=Zingiber officinale TaxID=94328 RepID=A0A8J5FSZ5_ZINOF|nr:uncharacterized protein LOC122002988 [Zingiber officinale]KAG6494453.1 hypothetical protein ZIOFF_049479 [Zingiber officinale]